MIQSWIFPEVGGGPLFFIGIGLSEINNEERFIKWQQWVDIISADIQALLINRHIFREVQDIIRKNNKIQVGSAFYDWMGIVYPSAMVMGIRRQLDTDRRSISLKKLLIEIGNHPDILTCDRYISLYNGTDLPVDVPNREFDRYSGERGSYIDPKLVLQDLKSIESKLEKIGRFATKRVAHLDEDDFEDLPTFGELDESLSLLEEIVGKYSLMLKAEPGPQVPTYQYDWKRIFRYPWIEKQTNKTNAHLGPVAG